MADAHMLTGIMWERPTATSQSTVCMVVTSSRVVQDWGKYLGDATMGSTILNRLMHRCSMLDFKGKSDRLKGAAARMEQTSAQADGQFQRVKVGQFAFLAL